MVLSQPPVRQELKPFIKNFHLIEVSGKLLSPQMVPASSKCVLNIPYGDSIKIQLFKNVYTAIKPFFIGLATQSYVFENGGSDIKCFLIEFNDIGFHALFRENGEQFADTLVELEDVVSSQRMQQLQDHLAEAKGPAAKVDLVEKFLLQFLPNKKTLERIERAETALQLIRQHKRLIDIPLLAHEVCLSERQLRRLITEVKGCSPKHFANIIRFTNIFSEIMMNREKAKWASLAYKYNYYDQMHFIKDFKSFSRFTPRAFPKNQFLFSSALSLPLYDKMKAGEGFS